MSDHLTLWIPGLRPDKQIASEARHYLGSLPKKETPVFTNLNLILSRADRITADDVMVHDFILEQLSENVDQKINWPLARWRLALEEQELEPGEHQWLCADPVYIHPDRSEALLFAHEELDIELDEARQIAELINRYYQEEPWELYIASTHRWYIKLNQAYDITTHELKNVKGKNIFKFLPEGNDARYWQQCMNELQMLLHGSDINQQRDERNQLPINSLWLWGYSNSPDNKPLHWRYIYSDDMVINGLGLLSGSEVYPLPNEFDDIEKIAGDNLVVIEQLKSALQQQDVFVWLDDLQYLEKYWFTPLVNKLRKTPGLQVTLLVSKDEAYQFDAKKLKRWWRLGNKNELF